MSRIAAWLTAIVVLVGICWRFPLFHLVPLKQTQGRQEAAKLNPTNFATTFWNDRLMKSLDPRGGSRRGSGGAGDRPAEGAHAVWPHARRQQFDPVFSAQTGHVVSVKKSGVVLH